MLGKLQSHVRNNVIGYVALFFALTGVAYAAVPLKTGDPAGGDLTGTYPNPSVANGAITPAKLNAGLSFTDAGLADLPASGCPEPPGWFNSGGFQRVSYARDPFGIVHLRGVATNCGGGGEDPVFTLPAGFRPGDEEAFNGLHIPMIGEDLGTGPIVVNTTGDVDAFGIPTQERISLSGVTFRCGPSGQNGCP